MICSTIRTGLAVMLGTSVLALPLSLFAGDLTPPNTNPNNAAGAMFTLEDIYNRLQSGAMGAARAGSFVEPTAGPTSGTGRTLNEIMNVAPVVDNSNGAQSAQVLQGRTYWGLVDANWGLQTGTMVNVGAQNITPGTTAQTITAGFHNGSGAVAGDADLVAGNIRSGITIFGVDGDTNVVDTSSGTATEAEIAAGAVAWVDGSEITGILSGGCNCSGGILSAGGRWCNNSNGTVTDLNSCLVWLRDVGCAGTSPWEESGSGSPVGAHSRAGNLFDGAAAFSGSDCNLTDSSTEGDWRLPTQNELLAVSNGTEPVRLSSPQFFTNLPATFGLGAVWTSTTVSVNPSSAWLVLLSSGTQNSSDKTFIFSVWPVRGGS